MRPATIGQYLAEATRRLAAAGIDTAARDARLLMADVLGLPADRVLLHEADPVSGEVEFWYENVLLRRLDRQPVSQITGKRDFYGRVFLVTEEVLDPRPDTETLVDLALAEPFAELLDLGTGSGCIAVTLLAERPQATGIATDISEAALSVAARNAETHGVADRLHLEISDWFERVGGRYDLIVSNPPYVSQADYESLAPDLAWEPKIALTPGGDGLAAYRAIAAAAPAHLSPNGRLLAEIGWDQGAAVADLFRAAGLDDVAVHPDINGKDRVVAARNPAG